MSNPLTYDGTGLKIMGDGNAEFVTLAKSVLEYIAANDGPGGIYLSDGGGSRALIGTFTDTSYSGNIGEGNATILSSTFNLYQDLTTPTGDEPPKPVTYNDKNSPIQVMTDNQLDNLANTILTWGLLNEGPHSFVLEASAPSDGGTWTSLGTLTDVYANSISTPIETNKNLYKKLSSGSYTINRPLKSNGLGELIEFTDTEINNIAKKVRERVVATGIGTYLFQQSSPSPGTWVSKGTITNTIATTVPENYTGVYTGTRSFASVPYSANAFFTGRREYPFEGPGFTDYTGGSYTGAAVFGARNFALFLGLPDTKQEYQGLLFIPGNTYAGSTTSKVFVGPKPYAGTSSFYTGDMRFEGKGVYTRGVYDANIPYTGIGYEEGVGPGYLERIFFGPSYILPSYAGYLDSPAAIGSYTADFKPIYTGDEEGYTTSNYVGFNAVFDPGFYLGPGLLYYEGSSRAFYTNYNTDLLQAYTGAGVNLDVYSSSFQTGGFYYQSEYTGTVNFLVFDTFASSFSAYPDFFNRDIRRIAREGDTLSPLYTGPAPEYGGAYLDFELQFYDNNFWAGDTAASFAGPGPAFPVETYFVGPDLLYTGFFVFLRDSATGSVNYQSQLSEEVYTGIDNTYLADYTGLGPPENFEGYTTFTSFFTNTVLPFTGVFAGVLIEDTPIDVETITLWRRVA